MGHMQVKIVHLHPYEARFAHSVRGIEKKGIQTLKFVGLPSMQMCLVALVGATLEFCHP